MTTLPLSTAFREATTQAHEDAEHAVFITRLMDGGASASDFAAFTAQLHPVYLALEQAMDAHASHPAVAALHDPLLIRTPRLASDLGVLYGADWADQAADGRIAIMPATRAYVERIGSLERPEALVAHHYVRLLGDLSGGQAIARLVRRHYGIPDAALTFYRFDGIDKAKPYKDAYRATLDALPLDAETHAMAVREAIRTFRLNQAVFADLEQARSGALRAAS